jgi:hypothetical protein
MGINSTAGGINSTFGNVFHGLVKMGEMRGGIEASVNEKPYSLKSASDNLESAKKAYAENPSLKNKANLDDAEATFAHFYAVATQQEIDDYVGPDPSLDFGSTGNQPSVDFPVDMSKGLMESAKRPMEKDV